MYLIKREFYLNELQKTIRTNSIKVITGVRRSGKSKLLESFIDLLKNEDKKANIIFIKLQLPANKYLRNHNSLYAYISSRWLKNKNNYVLIDEIQMCAE
ncbi:MAG: AAA family ATPase, partial [Malacoplasma sp.]|nr:AAA family ATPase [Malacoplasma sp.]